MANGLGLEPKIVAFTPRTGWLCSWASKMRLSSIRRTHCSWVISNALREFAGWWKSLGKKATVLTPSSSRARHNDSGCESDESQRPAARRRPGHFSDRKDREYLFRLDRSHPISIRGGKISADEIIGQDEGSVVRSSLNEPFLVFRPSFPQLIPNLPRNAQIIYPKDIGPILVWADLFPGARVVEAGLGAGALSMALLRAIGTEGHLFSYEIREDFADMARKNVAKYFGPVTNWTVKVGDVAAALDETEIDRMIL